MRKNNMIISINFMMITVEIIIIMIPRIMKYSPKFNFTVKGNSN